MRPILGDVVRKGGFFLRVDLVREGFEVFTDGRERSRANGSNADFVGKEVGRCAVDRGVSGIFGPGTLTWNGKIRALVVHLLIEEGALDKSEVIKGWIVRLAQLGFEVRQEPRLLGNRLHRQARDDRRARRVAGTRSE